MASLNSLGDWWSLDLPAAEKAVSDYLATKNIRTATAFVERRRRDDGRAIRRGLAHFPESVHSSGDVTHGRR
jgi:hypothetical protein